MFVRHATEADLAQVKALADANKDALGFVPLPALRTGLAHNWLLVAGLGTRILGFAHYRHRRDQQTTLYEFCVDQAVRGDLFGYALFNRMCQEAREQGQRHVRLKCPCNLPANVFYARFGCVLTGQEQGKKRVLNIWEYPL